MARVICGVDVSKVRLDVCVWPARHLASFERSAEGVAGLLRLCREHGVELVVMEATGGLERLVFTLLSAEGMGCAVVNAARVRAYAKAMGALEKTDRLDAEMIARFALAGDVAAMSAPREQDIRLQARVSRLRQVTDDLTVNRQRIAACQDEEARASLGEVIALLVRQSKTLEGEIASSIADDPLWSKLDEAFRAVPGVGHRTVARLMADLPEIGTVSNKAIAKLAGLAPLADDSGKRQGKRSIRGGRASVRTILFIISHAARKHDETLAAFYERLIKANKPKMVARIAVAHKLLVWLNAKARDTRAAMKLAT